MITLIDTSDLINNHKPSKLKNKRPKKKVFKYEEMNKDRWDLYRVALKDRMNTIPMLPVQTLALKEALSSNKECPNAQQLLDEVWHNIWDCFDEAAIAAIPYELKRSGYCIC